MCTFQGNSKNELICGITWDYCSCFEQPVQTISFEFKLFLSCISKHSSALRWNLYGVFPFSGINTNFVGFPFLVLIRIFLNLKKVSDLQFKIRMKAQKLHWELVLIFSYLNFAQNHPSLSFQTDFKFPLYTSSNRVVNVILSFYKFPSSHYSQR